MINTLKFAGGGAIKWVKSSKDGNQQIFRISNIIVLNLDGYTGIYVLVYYLIIINDTMWVFK